MKAFRLLFPAALISLALFSQTSLSQPPQDAAQNDAPGLRGGRGMWGGVMGSGVMGTVKDVAPDHFTIKTDSGEIYTIYYSVNTRIMKGGGGGGSVRHSLSDEQPQFTPPQPIKATEIKVGDAIAASGEMDANAKSVGAVVIFQIDPERARQLREMQANYGKTWLMGRVTTINEVKVTLQGGPENATHTFVADENTTFRKRRDPIALADIQPGDMIRVEGAIKNGEFVATSVAVMGPRPDRPNSPAPPQP